MKNLKNVINTFINNEKELGYNNDNFVIFEVTDEVLIFNRNKFEFSNGAFSTFQDLEKYYGVTKPNALKLAAIEFKGLQMSCLDKLKFLDGLTLKIVKIRFSLDLETVYLKINNVYSIPTKTLLGLNGKELVFKYEPEVVKLVTTYESEVVKTESECKEKTISSKLKSLNDLVNKIKSDSISKQELSSLLLV